MFRKMLLACVLLCAANSAKAQELPVNQVRFVGGPDINTFAQTTSITQVIVQSNGTELQFSKKDGADRWPDNVTPGWAGALQYSIGMCLNIKDEWVCSAPVEVWHNRTDATGPIQDNTVTCKQGYRGQVACNWFYDDRWSTLKGRQPAAGEQIGMFVVAGDARSNFNPVRERSNIVLLNLPGPGETRTFTYNEVAPQPTTIVVATPSPSLPQQPTQPIAHPLLESALVDLARQMQACNEGIASVNENVNTGRAEAQTFFTGVKNTWQSIGGPVIAKYVLPALGASIATWRIAK